MAGVRCWNVVLLLVVFIASVMSMSTSTSASNMRRVGTGNGTRYCGWELMQNLQIPIPTLGTWYARQTGDRSLCVRQDDGTEYCTCIYECGNGVWRNVDGELRRPDRDGRDGGTDGQSGGEDQEGEDAYAYTTQMAVGKGYGKWKWEEGCKKYCHAGVCDGQG